MAARPERSLERIGLVRLAAGERAGALAAFEESLGVRRKLAMADPGNAEWQGDLALTLDLVGNVRSIEGDRNAALQGHEESLAIRRKLAAVDPDNVRWQYEIGGSLDRVGDVRLAAGERPRRWRPTGRCSRSCASLPPPIRATRGGRLTSP